MRGIKGIVRLSRNLVSRLHEIRFYKIKYGRNL